MKIMEASIMRQIEKIRQRCLEEIDNHYADRMTKLVDDLRLEDAEAIMHEMTYNGNEDDDVDLFLDDLTEWNNDDLNGIYFEDLNDKVDD
tara:strand:+ start:742 stop:1011 length:270 start_codon:yes stop_codon:yes gene_type:complete